MTTKKKTKAKTSKKTKTAKKTKEPAKVSPLTKDGTLKVEVTNQDIEYGLFAPRCPVNLAISRALKNAGIKAKVEVQYVTCVIKPHGAPHDQWCKLALPGTVCSFIHRSDTLKLDVKPFSFNLTLPVALTLLHATKNTTN